MGNGASTRPSSDANAPSGDIQPYLNAENTPNEQRPNFRSTVAGKWSSFKEDRSTSDHAPFFHDGGYPGESDGDSAETRRPAKALTSADFRRVVVRARNSPQVDSQSRNANLGNDLFLDIPLLMSHDEIGSHIVSSATTPRRVSTAPPELMPITVHDH